MRHAADNSDGLKLYQIRNYVAGIFEDNLNMIPSYFDMYVIMISYDFGDSSFSCNDIKQYSLNSLITFSFNQLDMNY